MIRIDITDADDKYVDSVYYPGTVWEETLRGDLELLLRDFKTNPSGCTTFPEFLLARGHTFLPKPGAVFHFKVT